MTAGRLARAGVTMASIGCCIATGPGLAAQGDIRPLTRAYNMSGQELLRSLAATPGNVVLSPLSIGTAMAMVLSGARGETADEMRQVLRHTLSGQAIDAANASALAALLDRSGATDAKSDAGTLRIANALMLVNPSATIADTFRDTIRTQYRADIFKDAGLATVNNWVKDKTDGKIPTIIERLNPQDSHVLLNAIYFKAPWAQAFARNATRDRAFHLTATDKAEVPTMALSGAFAVEKGDGFQAIRLPYAADGLSMIVVRPDAVDGADAVLAALDGTKLEALMQALRKAPPRPVNLTLPRFKFASAAALIPPFKALGMSKVFDPAVSDLSGLTGLPREAAQSTIDQIAHRAVIEVAEEGTEAAAATAVVVTTRAMAPGSQQRFEVDRPFLFLIADDSTGAILFAGRVSDPRK